MKFGVIDIGSNSVRLMISEDGKTLYKLVEITALAEGMGVEKTLKEQAVDRTVSTVSFFVEHAKSEKVDEILIYATAAVRYASNKDYFVKRIKMATGIDLDVISGELEGYIGRLGALSYNDGGIIDVGGASAEITAVKDGTEIYSKSLDIGVVKIKDACGQDKEKALDFITEKIKEYGDIPKVEYYGIGGTATSIASLMQELEPYDPNKVDGFVIKIEELEKWANKLYSLSLEEKSQLKGLQPKRAEVISGGALLLYKILKKIGVSRLIVSEKDNLEGYLTYKRG
jgi:exopolyphosphatase/guanosine-5'-triphosphate,3'-diphosphate pyrophosphatase